MLNGNFLKFQVNQIKIYNGLMAIYNNFIIVL